MSEKQGGNFSLETYISKQETLLVENIRRVLQAETKIVLLESALQEMYRNNESLNEQIEVLNQTVQQSVAGLQATAVERDHAQNRVRDLERILNDCEHDRTNTRSKANENGNRVAVLENEMRLLNNKLDVASADYATLKENYARVVAALEEAQQKTYTQEAKPEVDEQQVVTPPTKKKRSNKEKTQSTESEWIDGEY